MNRAATGSILQVLRGIIEDQRIKALADAELLRLFSDQRDEAAFRGLLRRHGGMVLIVCRNVLGNEADVEDAFQATFLQLARKACAIRNTAAVGSWLYGVAYRTALKTRADLARRARHEKQKSSETSPLVTVDPHLREIQEIVLAELNRFSERYRAPLVLCYLEGKTQEQAALMLGIPKATVKKQLERARALLRVRLVRQGLGAALVSAWPGQAWAYVPPALASQTMKAALALAASQGAANLLWIKLAVFTERVINVMLMHKYTTTVVGTMTVGIVAFVGSVAVQSPRGPTNQANAQVPVKAAQQTKEETRIEVETKKTNKAEKDDDPLRGEWVKIDKETSSRILLVFNDPPSGLPPLVAGKRTNILHIFWTVGDKKGMAPDGAKTADPVAEFNFFANGRNFFMASDNARLRKSLDAFLREKGITSGVVTKDLYLAFAQARAAGQIAGDGVQTKNAIFEQISQFAVMEFKRLDRNEDDQLDTEEMPNQLKEELSRWDTNQDNLINIEEFKLFFFNRFNGGGLIQPSEIRRIAVMEFERLDLNGDGLLTLEEMTQKMKSQLSQWDSNRDRQVSLSEFVAYYTVLFNKRYSQYAPNDGASGKPGTKFGPPLFNGLGVKYSITEKNNKKILVSRIGVRDFEIPFEIKGDTLILDGGIFEQDRPDVDVIEKDGEAKGKFKVELKGQWLRVPATSSMDGRLKQAFPEGDVHFFPIKLHLPSRNLLIAAHEFHIDRDGRVRLENCAIALFGPKEEMQPTTVRSSYVIITLDNPVNNFTELSSRKFRALEFANGLRLDLQEK
jgi:RNA polymerase sigma factor (sigma-70 family)